MNGGKMKSPRKRAAYRRILEARVGIEPTHKGFADLSLTTWVPRLMGNMKPESWLLAWEGWQRHAAGAGDGGRTRDFDLGKVALYH
jgi:hypothetical protein